MVQLDSTPATPRLNVVLICVDQWRGDCIDGHPVAETQTLDALLRGGTKMERAYVACPSCIAARASLFTGLTPASHGRVGYQEGVPWNYPVTLAGQFTQGGYQTQAVGKMHVFPDRNRLGFEHVVLHDGYTHYGRKTRRDMMQVDDYWHWLKQRVGVDVDYAEHGMHCNAYTARPWDKAEELHPTNFIVSQSVDFLRRRDPTKPFFLFMSFHRPHPPLDPPQWAFERYVDEEMPDAPVGDWAPVFDGYREGGVGRGSRAKLARLRRLALAGYYGHLTHIDGQIGRFLEALEAADQHKNTVIAFVSDHGDLLGDHGLWAKALPYEGSARVPMFFHGPCAGIQLGKVIDAPVELCDIMPTLLDLAGLPIPKTVEGQSLASALRGGTQEFRPFVHGEHARYGSTMQYLTDGREKYVWLGWNGVEQLFDLRRDPQELHDLSKENPQRLQHWRGLLIEQLKDRPEGLVRDGKLVAKQFVNPVLIQPQRHGATEEEQRETTKGTADKRR